MNVVIELPTEQRSEQVAKQFAAYLAPCIMTFSGDIGVGKTTMIRAMLRALGVTGAIKSPTFSLVESYCCNALHVHHFDLYRIQDEFELDYIGFRDYFQPGSVCCIEWPERLAHYREHVDLAFTLSIKGQGREMHAQALSAKGVVMLTNLAGSL